MNELKELYRISSPSGNEFKMVSYIEKKLKEYGAETHRDRYNNLYATKGIASTYPCIVAHTDEVHTSKPKGFAVKQLGQVLIGFDTIRNEFAGIGADDKNGIWIALKCFEKYDIIKGAFFVEEEIGCVGSRNADMLFFGDCRFVLQCDRRGSADFINNASGVELCSKEFINDTGISKFGYKEATGIMTDVMELKSNGLNISACNISCGYYNPHTDEEYTNLNNLNNCLNLVFNIIEKCKDVYTHKYEYKHKYNSKFDFNDWYSDKYKGWDTKGTYSNDSLFGDDDFNYNAYSTEYDKVKIYIENKVMSGEIINENLLLDDILDLYPTMEADDVIMAYEEVTGSSLFA